MFLMTPIHLTDRHSKSIFFCTVKTLYTVQEKAQQFHLKSHEEEKTVKEGKMHIF